jgi:hypothetical protein
MLPFLTDPLDENFDSDGRVYYYIKTEMKTKVNSRKENSGARCAGTKRDVRVSYSAYGDRVPICMNTGCVMRKQAGCFGFEGCPGFKSR